MEYKTDLSKLHTYCNTLKWNMSKQEYLPFKLAKTLKKYYSLHPEQKISFQLIIKRLVMKPSFGF